MLNVVDRCEHSLHNFELKLRLPASAAHGAKLVRLHYTGCAWNAVEPYINVYEQ